MPENIHTHFKKTFKKTRKPNVNVAYFTLEKTCLVSDNIKCFDRLFFFIKGARSNLFQVGTLIFLHKTVHFNQLTRYVSDVDNANLQSRVETLD